MSQTCWIWICILTSYLGETTEVLLSGIYTLACFNLILIQIKFIWRISEYSFGCSLPCIWEWGNWDSTPCTGLTWCLGQVLLALHIPVFSSEWYETIQMSSRKLHSSLGFKQYVVVQKKWFCLMTSVDMTLLSFFWKIFLHFVGSY